VDPTANLELAKMWKSCPFRDPKYSPPSLYCSPYNSIRNFVEGCRSDIHSVFSPLTGKHTGADTASSDSLVHNEHKVVTEESDTIYYI
jgi:hypothetical protein